MKKALVLAGGGTRGAYQNGALKALRKLHKADFDIVTGTSIGALNAALVVQKDYKAMDNLWHTLTQDKIIKGSMSLEFNLDTMINERNLIASFFKNYVKEKGADISPLVEQVEYYFNSKKFFDSNIDFGCITVKHGSLKPEFVTKEMMKDHAIDWLISSASAFPAFPVHTFSEGSFIDGGYYDNLPIDFALRLGADELIVIDLNNVPQHPSYMYSDNVKYIYPKKPTGSFLNFDRKVMDDLEVAGYYDTMKTFGKYDGIIYTFKKMKYPSYYREFMRKFMMMENDIKVAAQINKKINFRSESYLRDRISESIHVSCVSDKQIFFALVDELMTICNLDEHKVWDYKEAQKLIVEHFMSCVKEDYAYLPKLVPTDIVNYVSSLDEEGIVSKFVHFMAYEEHSPFKDGIYLTIYPFEKCLAMLVIEMMKDEIGEVWKK